MDNLTITCLRYTLEAETPIRLGAQAGAQLRGGLYNELLKLSHPTHQATQEPAHQQTCPVCQMLARENPMSARGQQVPRPFGLRPPLTAIPHGIEYRPGATFELGLHLYGATQVNYPLFTLAVSQLGRAGVGYGRGRFRLVQIMNEHPLTGAALPLLSNGMAVAPTLHVTAVDVAQAATQLATDHLTLHFQTPMRLIEQGKLLHQPQFRPLMGRLIERLEALNCEYAAGQRWGEHYHTLMAAAASIQTTHSQTEWLEVHSGSRRTMDMTPISGFIGQATFRGDLTPLLPLLVWGSLTQVGKNVVKGDGWYTLAA